MPENNLSSQVTANDTSRGRIRINVLSSLGQFPIADASVSISAGNTPANIFMQLSTDISGLTETVELPAPSLAYSMQPENTVKPYAEYTITVSAPGYEPVEVTGSELFADTTSMQTIRMNPLETTEDAEKFVTIPAHTLWGNYPPKIPEAEIKPIPDTGEIVLSRVVVPEYIIVHDGVHSDNSAPNYWVKYTDYIKNVASSEIYATWPDATIRANVLAIMSFTLNSKTIEQLDNIIEDINQEILDISNKYKYDCNDFNSQFEGTRMRAYNNHKNCKKQIDLLEYKKESIENYKLNFRKNKQKVK